jgi:hypothetical protein
VEQVVCVAPLIERVPVAAAGEALDLVVELSVVLDPFI